MLGDLLASPGVEEVFVAGGPVGVMALHGGLEAGTFEIAQEVAHTTGASLYAVIQPHNLRWHVPSILFDPAASSSLRRFLAHARFAISVHGFGRQGVAATALLGGCNREAAARLAMGLGRHGFAAVSDHDAMPRGLRGLHGRNPVNLPEQGGVQVELTPDLRRTPQRHRFIAALAAELPQLAAEILTNPRPEVARAFDAPPGEIPDHTGDRT